MIEETNERLIGVDVGTRRVGVAVTDEDGRFALPYETLDADSAPQRLAELAADRGVSTFVVGWPLQLDGAEGRATRNVDRFIERLESELVRAAATFESAPIPNIVRYDERLTTSAAQNLLGEASVFGKKRKAVVDQVAATQILQNYLDGRS